jgi:hypothetical protein
MSGIAAMAASLRSCAYDVRGADDAVQGHLIGYEAFSAHPDNPEISRS